MAKRGHVLGCSIALGLAALSYVLSISPLWLEDVLYYGFGGLLILPGVFTPATGALTLGEKGFSMQVLPA